MLGRLWLVGGLTGCAGEVVVSSWVGSQGVLGRVWLVGGFTGCIGRVWLVVG